MASKDLTDHLKDFVLDDITIPQGEELGRGAYGKVFTVIYQELPYAAKEIHSLLLEGVSLEEKKAIKDGFVRECYNCNLLRHPNIVQFMGVYYGAKPSNSRYDPRHDLPIMVMELMDTSLTSFIKINQSKIATKTKLSILQDISLGLTYLHRHCPAVIHRDLSSNNVLLSKGHLLIAKISDLGTAKIIRADSKQTKSRLTTAPGTLHFMPPEALVEDNPVYGTPVDVFSFGGISIHLFSEEWPTPSAPKTKDPKTKKFVAHSESARRQQYLDKIPIELISLKEMMIQCLDDDADERPLITEVSEMINSLNVSYVMYVLL